MFISSVTSKINKINKNMKHIKTFESFLNENINEMVKSFIYAKPETEFSENDKDIKKAASDFLQYLKDQKYTWNDMSFLYFPDFVWAGGKQKFGPSIGILIGSDTIAIRPIGTDKMLKVNDGLMYRLIQNGKLESYAFKF
jgi:hypothetical protein